MRKQHATMRAKIQAATEKRTVECWSRVQQGAVKGTPRVWRTITTDDNIALTGFDNWTFECAFNQFGRI